MAALAGGCGGGDDSSLASRQPRWTPDTDLAVTSADPETSRRSLAEKDKVIRVAMARREPQKYSLATSDEATLILEDPYGRKIGAFELRPVRGRGYVELKATITARQIGEALPPEPLRPTCSGDATCEFRTSKRYTLVLSDDAVLKLVPRGDAVALVAKTLKLEAPVTVELIFSSQGQEISRKSIRLLTDYFEVAAK